MRPIERALRREAQNPFLIENVSQKQMSKTFLLAPTLSMPVAHTLENTWYQVLSYIAHIFLIDLISSLSASSLFYNISYPECL